MTNPIPLNTFLDWIDPDKTVDRIQTAYEIGSLAMSQTLNETIGLLSQEKQDQIMDQLKSNPNIENLDLAAIYASDNKLNEFTTHLANKSKDLTNEYIRTCLNAIPKEQLSSFLNQHPDLRALIN